MDIIISFLLKMYYSPKVRDVKEKLVLACSYPRIKPAISKK